jgi:hypothetical protein
LTPEGMVLLAEWFEMGDVKGLLSDRASRDRGPKEPPTERVDWARARASEG